MIKQLANGLVLRTLSEGYASDRAGLPEFYAEVNGEDESEGEKAALIEWTEDLMEGHPTTTPDDIFVVVDPSQNDRIASATLLIPQTWRYEEIPISVGRPELVGTRQEYRSQGLVRILFDAVHERSASLGHQLQSITGIPYFYRRFGYTMAADLGDRASLPLLIPSYPADYQPAFTLRPATLDDIAGLSTWQSYMARERLLTDLWPVEQWHYTLAGRRPGSLENRAYLIIQNAEGEGVGYIVLFPFRFNEQFQYCFAYVVGDQSSYVETFRDTIYAIKQWTLASFGAYPSMLYFSSGIHESLEYLIGRFRGGNVRHNVYKWYLRVPDMIAFLRHIQPVLERRLEGSGANRYTGELKIGFYDLKGIELKFERGRITEITSIKGKDGYDISFPWDLFLNVLFGDHSYEEINAVLPDVSTGGKGAVLLNALFPKKKSWLVGLA